MGKFIVKSGTECLVVHEDRAWYTENFKKYTTTVDLTFDKWDLEIDPTGLYPYACGPWYSKVVGGDFANQGVYGFKRKAWMLLVRIDDVTYA